MATTLDIFSELLASIAHIQTLVAKNSVFQALQEINDTLYNVQRTEQVPDEVKDKVQLHLTDARDLLTQEMGRQQAADSIWLAYVAARLV